MKFPLSTPAHELRNLFAHFLSLLGFAPGLETDLTLFIAVEKPAALTTLFPLRIYFIFRQGSTQFLPTFHPTQLFPSTTAHAIQ